MLQFILFCVFLIFINLSTSCLSHIIFCRFLEKYLNDFMRRV